MSDIIWANTIFPWFMISVFCNTICKSTKSLSQICRSIKCKNDITRCFTTCYVVISCGGRTRTCDLQVMSLASYQLLHSAMLLFRFCECKGTKFFWFHKTSIIFFALRIIIIDIYQSYKGFYLHSLLLFTINA